MNIRIASALRKISKTLENLINKIPELEKHPEIKELVENLKLLLDSYDQGLVTEERIFQTLEDLEEIKDKSQEKGESEIIRNVLRQFSAENPTLYRKYDTGEDIPEEIASPGEALFKDLGVPNVEEAIAEQEKVQRQKDQKQVNFRLIEKTLGNELEIIRKNLSYSENREKVLYLDSGNLLPFNLELKISKKGLIYKENKYKPHVIAEVSITGFKKKINPKRRTVKSPAKDDKFQLIPQEKENLTRVIETIYKTLTESNITPISMEVKNTGINLPFTFFDQLINQIPFLQANPSHDLLVDLGEGREFTTVADEFKTVADIKKLLKKYRN